MIAGIQYGDLLLIPVPTTHTTVAHLTTMFALLLPFDFIHYDPHSFPVGVGTFVVTHVVVRLRLYLPRFLRFVVPVPLVRF